MRNPERKSDPSASGPLSSSGASVSGSELRRVLGPFDVTMIVMGSIVGAGVFNRPSEVAAAMHSTPGVLGLWALGGVFAFTGAIVFAELGGMLPHAGGQYVFVREAFGRFAAFLFGWVLLTGISSSALAFVAGVFADHVEELTRDFGGLVYAGGHARLAVAIALIVVVTALNACGVRLGALVQDASMLAKIAGILAIVVLGALVLFGWLASNPPALSEAQVRARDASAGGSTWSWAAAGGALLSVMFTYGGWQNVAAVAGEIRRPERSLPLGILLGTVGVIALYLALNGSLIAILGVERIASTKTPTADAARAVVEFGGTLVAALVVLSTFAFVQGLSMLAPRIYYAMACDGVFFRSVARLHPKWKTPEVAIVLQGAIAVAHVLFAGEELGALVDICILCDLVFFTSCGFALFWLRKKRPDAPRPYRALWYPVLPAIFCATALTAVVQGLFNAKAGAALGGAILFAVGIGAYALWSRKRAV